MEIIGLKDAKRLGCQTVWMPNGLDARGAFHLAKFSVFKFRKFSAGEKLFNRNGRLDQKNLCSPTASTLLILIKLQIDVSFCKVNAGKGKIMRCLLLFIALSL